MAKKTNCTKNGQEYYRIRRKVGKRRNQAGQWVDHFKDFYGSCKSDAEAKYKTYKETVGSGIDLSGHCLGDLIDDWIRTTFDNCDLAESSKRKYKEAYQNNFQNEPVAGKLLQEVTAADLQDWINNNPARYSAKRSTLNLLRRFYRYVELTGMGRNITGSIELQKPKNDDINDFSPIEVWEDDELKKLYQALNGHRLRLLVILAVNTGARFSELLALTYSDISNGTLRINKQVTENGSAPGIQLTDTKTASSRRVVPLSDPVQKEIEIHRKWHLQEMAENGYQTDNIFTTNTGHYYYRRSVLHALERACKSNGIRYRKFHAFRHTFGTNLSRVGVPIEETAALMGHSDITITAKYYVEISATRKQSAVDRLADLTLPG